MSVKTEIARISEAKAAIRESIEKKGQTIAADAKIDTFSAVIDLLSNIDGAACGKFTWDGNYPIYCGCPSLSTPPTAFLLYCPSFVNSGEEGYHALLAAKGVGTAISTAVLRVTANNSASVGTYQTGIVYDAENKAVKIANNFVGTLMSGQDYYWIAV